MTDERLLQLCRLGLSVPLPESSPETAQESPATSDVFKKELQREARSMARSNKDLEAVQNLFLDSDSPDEGIASSGEEEMDVEEGEVFFDATDSEHPRKRRKSHKDPVKYKTVDVNFTTVQVCL